MATTNFSNGTTITAEWCNDVDAFVYAGEINVPVEIRTDSATTSIISYRTNASGQDFRAIRFEADASTSSGLYLGKSRGATIADYTILQTNDSLGRIIFGGANGTDMLSGVSISASVDAGTPSATSMPGVLKFNTTPDGSTTLTLRQTIDSAGNVSIGESVPVAGRTFTLNKAITGSTSAYGCINSGVVQSDVTTLAKYFNTSAATQATAFTCASLTHYSATQGTIGAGSTVTTQFGYYASSTLTGATTNYGFYGNLAAASGVYNFYAGGTAPNYFAGTTTFGGKIGYGIMAGVGGEVTQNTNKSTAVTLNKLTGQITMHAASLAASTSVSFTLNNSFIDSTDLIITNIVSGATAGSYFVTVDAVGSGTCRISLRNVSGGALAEAVIIGFAVIEATNA